MHQKKQKGDLGLAKCIARITEIGWVCCLPLTEHSKYDLIIEYNKIMLRVQCRYTTVKNGALSVKLRSCWADKKGIHSTNRVKGDFDLLAIYSPTNDSVYFINDDDFSNETVLILRLDKPKRDLKNIRMAEQFTEIKR